MIGPSLLVRFALRRNVEDAAAEAPLPHNSIRRGTALLLRLTFRTVASDQE